jgi:hypothetical protein
MFYPEKKTTNLVRKTYNQMELKIESTDNKNHILEWNGFNKTTYSEDKNK